MVRTKKDPRVTFWQNYACGGIAGCLSKTTIAPLDVIKIRTQVGTPETKNGMIRGVATLYQHEGWRAFWKGNLMGCVRLMPYSALQLAAFHRLKWLLADSHGRLNAASALIAGAGGGVVATIGMYPTDTIKTRLIVQNVDKSKANYRGIFDALSTIIKQEGVAGLYRGVSTSIIGVIPFAGATFLAYELLDRYTAYSPVTPQHSFVHGCAAAGFAQTVSMPFDTVRKKMQAYSPVLPDNGGVDIRFTSMRDAFRQVLRHEGLLSFWSGLAANLLKIVPYTGLMFYVYERCKNVCLYQNGYTLSPFKDLPHPYVDQTLKPHELEEYQTYGPLMQLLEESEED